MAGGGDTADVATSPGSDPGLDGGDLRVAGGAGDRFDGSPAQQAEPCSSAGPGAANGPRRLSSRVVHGVSGRGPFTRRVARDRAVKAGPQVRPEGQPSRARSVAVSTTESCGARQGLLDCAAGLARRGVGLLVLEWRRFGRMAGVPRRSRRSAPLAAGVGRKMGVRGVPTGRGAAARCLRCLSSDRLAATGSAGSWSQNIGLVDAGAAAELDRRLSRRPPAKAAAPVSRSVWEQRRAQLARATAIGRDAGLDGGGAAGGSRTARPNCKHRIPTRDPPWPLSERHGRAGAAWR